MGDHTLFPETDLADNQLCSLRELILFSPSLTKVKSEAVHPFQNYDHLSDFKTIGQELQIQIPALGHFYNCKTLDWSDTLSVYATLSVPHRLILRIKIR